MIEEDIREYERYFGAELQWSQFQEMFERRLTDSSIKIPKAIELNFLKPKSEIEKRIKASIDKYHAAKESEWQQEVFKQKKRLADAERSLKDKQTKKALNDQRIATNKIESLVSRLSDLKRTTFESRDARIFPFNYAPLVINEDGRNKVILARYHCRPAGKPANYDQRYDGLYNARRDSLEGFWKGLFTKHHAVMLIKSFYENVALHNVEHRELKPDEKPQNVVLHFNPKPMQTMMVACLWSRWEGKGEPTLDSFAAITDEPPPEIAAAGHDRVVITLKPEHAAAWLSANADAAAYYRLFDDRQRPVFEHRRAA
jgi:putative SOS response-associated peptidase YedK